MVSKVPYSACQKTYSTRNRIRVRPRPQIFVSQICQFADPKKNSADLRPQTYITGIRVSINQSIYYQLCTVRQGNVN